MNVDDEEGPYTLPWRQAYRRAEGDEDVSFGNVEAVPDILPGWHMFRLANDDLVENVEVGETKEPRLWLG